MIYSVVLCGKDDVKLVLQIQYTGDSPCQPVFKSTGM